MAAITVFDRSKILQKIRRGDQASFGLLYAQYFDMLAGEIFFILKDRTRTEEVIQDVFCKIWRDRDKLETISNFEGYLRVLSRNGALNVLKSDLRRRKTEQNYYQEQVNMSVDYHEVDLQKEHYRLLDLAIEKLPAQQKKVYQLSRFERMKYVEIAKQLNLSKESVKSYLKIATVTIKKHLAYHKDSIVCFIFIFHSF